MPRKAPTQVIEHRISLSDYERKNIKTLVEAKTRQSYFDSASSILNGITWPVLGIAALLYVGFSLDDLVDDTKKFIDNQSDKLTGWLEKKGIVNYTADEYGREVEKIRNEQGALFEENAELNARIQAEGREPTDAELKRINQIHKRMAILDKREKVLTQLIADIASGKTKWYEYSWFAAETSGEHKQALDRAYARQYRAMYDEEPDDNLDWILELGSNQTISDEDPSEYGYSA